MAAKQSVTLTGLGSTEFEAAARAVLAIHTMFSSTLPDDALVPWKPQKDTDYVCLEFYNRYFKGRDETGSPAADIGTEIDPLGILRTRCPLGEHTEDNVVLYFERNTANITGYVVTSWPSLQTYIKYTEQELTHLVILSEFE